MPLLELLAKKPRMRSRGAAVVTDGATIALLEGVNAPLCESTGADASIPLTSMIPPAADTDEANAHV